MKIKCTSSFDVQKILNKRGMGKDKRLRKYLAGRVRLRCMPYTPRAQGTLSNTAHVAKDGDAVVWDQPYAHYQYHGEVMAGRAPKHYTGKALQHHGAPMRGPNWDKRMMADHSGDIEKDVAAYLGGNAHDRD